MAPLNQTSTFRLRNRVNAILQWLRTQHPAEIEELELLQGILNARDSSDDLPYSLIKMPRTAVMQLLTEVDKPLSKQEIYEELHKRGFKIETSARKGHVNNSINYLLKTGALEKIGSGERGDMVVTLSRSAFK